MVFVLLLLLVSGPAGAQEVGEPIFHQLVGGEVADAETEQRLNDTIHLFPHVLQENTSEDARRLEYEGAAFVELAAGNYHVIVAPFPLYGGFTFPDYAFKTSAVTTCGEETDNTIYELEDRIVATMHCSGVIEWQIESDYPFLVVVVLGSA